MIWIPLITGKGKYDYTKQTTQGGVRLEYRLWWNEVGREYFIDFEDLTDGRLKVRNTPLAVNVNLFFPYRIAEYGGLYCLGPATETPTPETLGSVFRIAWFTAAEMIAGRIE